MKIKGNEWLGLKEVKEKPVSSAPQRWWEVEGTETEGVTEHVKKVFRCACLCCTQGFC